ncbi:hypothetical protein [Jannaschia sp. R86511]|uniref:hypothetical protein n=1 Tax=Jannaschia sp. R86511 TaxID=3093853 RepID=UPI0036D22A38
MPSDGQSYVYNELLGRLVGFRLYSVQFVMDYVQLRFDGPTHDEPVLNCDVMPVVETEHGRVAPGATGYADALVALIEDSVVETAEAWGQGLRLQLTRGTLVVLPSVHDLEGPEIALLQGFQDERWMCWRPGEEAFEHMRDADPPS